MALSDQIDQILNLPVDHPMVTQFLSLLPAVAGAALQARTDKWGRQSRIGAPLGAGLQVLGEWGLSKTGGTKPAAPVLMNMPDGTMQYVEPTAGLTLPKGETPWQKSTGEDKGTRYYNTKTGSWDWFAQGAPVPAGYLRQPATEKPEAKPGSPEVTWEQSWLAKNPGDLAGAAAFAEQQNAKYAPAPLPAIIPITTPAGTTGIESIPRTRGGTPGTPTLIPLASGATAVGKAPAPPKPWRAKNAADLINSVQKQVKTELTTTGFFGNTKPPTGAQIKAETTIRLLQMGYDSRGMPLPLGATAIVGGP